MQFARRHAVPIALALASIALAWAYAATTLHATRGELGLPLDDSYIYFTYAKQIGRGQPFTYMPGGGYSAGATSMTWPLVLAPLWTLGARGHALVWAAYIVSALLLAASVIVAARVTRVFAHVSSGIAVAALVLATPAFVWVALSGMEVALVSALVHVVIALLVERPTSRALPWILAALGLARPEAAMIVSGVCIALAVSERRWQRLLPLLAPLAWLLANRILAGHWLPNTALAKSQLYLPGFTWSGWADTLATNAWKLVRGLAWTEHSPLPQARLFALGWLVGCVRLVMWARHERAARRIAVAVIIGAPLVWFALVLASSGMWTLQQYRYIAAMFPLLALPVGAAIAPVARWSPRAAYVAAAIVVGIAVWAGAVRHRASALVFAQSAADTNAQVVKLGRYLHDRVPHARVLLHDAGALAYYSDAQVIDMLGLVSDEAIGVAQHGPGARFELLEAMPEAHRPTHIAYYTGWLGAPDFLGARLVDTPLGPKFARERIVGGTNMELTLAAWDHVGTGERPLVAHAGWSVVDRVDIADLASERAHAWTGALGVRAFGDPTTRWSYVAREVRASGLVLDGGRTIRGGHEAFTITRTAGAAATLVLRTGGPTAPDHEPIRAPVKLAITVDGVAVGELALPVTSSLVELELPLPPARGSRSRVVIRAASPYRALHWFVLERD